MFVSDSKTVSMVSSLHSIASIVISCFISLSQAQPAYVYNGVAAVTLEGQQNWTLKYPLGFLCEADNWKKTLTIDVTLTTCERWARYNNKNCQGDLIMAFGTSDTYFALTVGMPLFYEIAFAIL